MVASLIHLPIELNVDKALGVAQIRQRIGDHAEDVVAVEITRDQAVQVAEFLLKEFKIKRSKLVAGDESGFELFWNAYPKKEKKVMALNIWKRNNCTAVVEDILSDVETRKSSRSWIDGFVPNPDTYLSQKRYNDSAGSQQSRAWDGAL